MKVILLKDVEGLGQAGEVVRVAPGFARNFLIPQRQALVATDASVAQFESRRRQNEAVVERERRAAEVLAKQLEKESLTAQVRVGEEDRLFGSVTAQNIAELLAAKGLEVDRRLIDLEEPIRALGVYNINVRLHSQVTAVVKLWVVKE
ncbi:MAG: 50S ribosomal protein L9 [Candidatus Latescibacterota bacterium]